MEIKKDDDFEAQINIIPLVDIMLVLLIIFMLTAPVLKTAFEVNLPESTTAQVIEQPESVPTITISEKGQVRIDGMVVNSLSELEGILTRLRKREVIVEADRRVDYGKVIEVMDVIKRAGIDRIGLATEHRERRHSEAP